MGLLVALEDGLRASPLNGVTLAAATVDHALRAESASEALHVSSFCRQLGIDHAILTWRGQKPKTGLQAAARQARYGLLADHAGQIGADLIVTGHTLDDQQETIAMRRARSPESSTGMAPGVLVDRRVWALRPLITVRRADIRAYLGLRGVGWVDDPSNDNELFERVRVRKAIAASPQAGSGAASGGREEIARAVAERLLARATICDFRVATYDLRDWQVGDAIGLRAILHLAAVIGGRSHLAGREAAARIGRFIESGMPQRLSSERVVFERRATRLYLARENRGLQPVCAVLGSTIVWDQRFRIHNDGRENLTIANRNGGESAFPLLSAAIPDDLPARVRQTVLATEPVMPADCRTTVTVTPILASFDRFLPMDMLEIANALAFLGGLDHFPPLPTR